MQAALDGLHLLRSALELAGSRAGLSPVCLPEVALFCTARKPALRFVVPPLAGSRLSRAARDDALPYTIRRVRSRFIGNGWSELVAAEDGDEQMIVISRSQADADYIARAELSGAANEVGSALGYPPCCVEAADADLAGARWAHRLLERSGAGPFPYVVNRLATAWGGLCAVGELFPCRLNCSHARELGCASISALTEVGLVRLSDMLRIHATQTLWVHELGDVTRVRPVDERAWTMAQFASVC